MRSKTHAVTAFLAAVLLSTFTVSALDLPALNDAVDLGVVPLSPGLAQDLSTLPTDTPYGAFVHFASGTPEQHRALLEGYGLTITADFERYARAVFAVGVIGEFRALSREPAVSYLEENKQLEFLGDTGPWATRVRVAQEAVSGGPYFAPDNAILRGEGIGVAIVDSGINAPHPDLATRVVNNYKIVCTTPGLISTQTGQCFGPLAFVDVGNSASTDTSSGHGTHVAGIVAGEGIASTGSYPVLAAVPNIQGTFTGVAPGAKLFGYGTGEVISVLYATEAFQHILDNYNSFTPRIKVINNSYGDPAGTAYNPNGVFSVLTRALVAKGVTLVFAAGNSGDANNNDDDTSSFCKDPTPGVICVANYNDANTGHINNALDASSSRGQLNAPTTYPDLSAPGASITATCDQATQPVCGSGAETRWQPRYGTISGTSMAAPHVAGAVALLLQARPALTPAALEDLLQDSARKVTFNGAYVADPQNSGGTTNFGVGAGLLDLVSALNAEGVPGGGTGGGTGTPSVRITQPAEASDYNGTVQIPVAGTAHDGVIGAAAPAVQLLLDGDLDPALAGAADIVKLTVQETAAGAVTPGLTYRMTLRNAADFSGGAASITLRVTQNVNGRPFLTSLNTTPAAVTAAAPGTSNTAVATTVSRSGNVVTFFVPMANLLNPPANAPAHNVFGSSFIGGVVDMAPSPNPGAGADVLLRPMFGMPYTIARPQITPPPVAAVRLSLDGGAEQTTTLSGASPDYGWTAPDLDSTTLADGAHTLVATLYLNGLEAATHAAHFTITRAQVFSYDVVITSPADGEVMPRATVQVRGTSFTDDPSTNRSVTLEVTGPEPVAETTVTGVSPWTRDVDFNRALGVYTLTARLYVDGVLRDSYSVTVTVPAANAPPVANAGTNSSVDEGQTANLDGTASSDPDGDPLVYQWTQISGPAVTLNNAGTATANFTAPEVSADTVLSFRLTVSDPYGASSSDEVAVTVRNVNSPPPPGGEVSCQPHTIGFWRQQFERKSNGSQKFTAAESDALADHAVSLADGYFGSRMALLRALFASGNLGAEARAARQYAGLLLNLAGGDRSASLSYQTGLSGAEALDPSVYNTAQVGPTVDAATDWIRAQLPSGNLGGANEVADSINNGQGLICQ